ncbi:MAG: hypothetical protein BZ135_02205 [Methanosphaera sp. rholeuAM6]|nr:MAG: hypothetical protein BZ135_02205 [Methanosphaera sp. rholeuAM6]
MIPKISVIVPVYNVEQYLERCLDSIVNQSLKDIEIICINDGSTDNSLKILEEYAKKDDRIIVINQKNHGQGYSRNRGLDVARGEYVLFVDSDDWVDIDTCKELYIKSNQLDTDVLIYQVESYDDYSDRFYKEDYYRNVYLPKEFYGTVFNNRDISDYIFSLGVAPYGKLYRRSLLEKFNIRFPENIYFEDNPFYWEVMLASEKISIVNKFYSLRRYRENSIMADYDEKFLDVIRISNLVVEKFEKYDSVDVYKDRIPNYKIGYIRQWFLVIDDKYSQEFLKLMKEDFSRIKNNTDLHEHYLKNLRQDYRDFYINVLDCSDLEDFNKLNNYTQLIQKYNKIKDEVNRKTHDLNDRENKFKAKYEKQRQEISLLEKTLKDKEKNVSDSKSLFEKESAKKENELKVKESSLKQKEADLERIHQERLNEIVSRENELDEKERLYDESVQKQKLALDNYRDEQLNIISSKEKASNELIKKNLNNLTLQKNNFNEIKSIHEKQIKQKETLFSQKELSLNKQKNDFKTYRTEQLNHINSIKEEMEDERHQLQLKLSEYEKISNHHLINLLKFEKTPYISIIIPVYNVEDYLDECLNSLIGQTLKNIEIICVNDGSTDNSLPILRKYEKKDKRIRVFNQKNQGQGVARNKALDIAKGEYVMFIDSDDWLDIRACQILYDKVKEYDLDMLMFLIKNYSEERQYYEDDYYNISCLSDEYQGKIFNYRDLGKLIFQISISPCQKIYKRSLLENIRFSERIFFEDNPFYWECMLSANKISLLKKHLYLRRRHSSSTTALFKQNYYDVIKINAIVLDIFRKYKIMHQFPKEIAYYIVSYVKRWYNVMMLEYKEDYWRIMKDYFEKISDNPTIHELILENSNEVYKNFYLNTLKSNSLYELEYLDNMWKYNEIGE